MSTLAFSYTRFSTPGQAKGSSAAVQTAAAKAWCERNGAVLDSHSYRDLGVSGFTGDHRKNPDRHGLALFLNGLREGKIPKESFFLLYNLDRLTREDVRPAYSLFNQILEAGVHVVQLAPERVFRCDSTGSDAMMDVLTAVIELSRGNSESAVKSQRIRANWERTVSELRKGAGLVLPGKQPFWIDRVMDASGRKGVGKYKLNDKVSAVREIFRLAADGMGHNRISCLINKKFNLDLARPSVRLLLRSRVVLGEYQPGDKDGRVIGEPIRLYPPAITEDVFNLVQRAITGRTPVQGRRDSKRIYLFNRLMVDETGRGFTVSITSGGRRKLKFIPEGFLRGERACVSFPVEPFEAAVCECLSEIDPADILPADPTGRVNELNALVSRREALKAKIAEAEEALEEGSIPALVKKLRQWHGELAETETALAVARSMAVVPAAEVWADCKRLVRSAASMDAPEEDRLRLRSAVGRVVASMRCHFHGYRNWRCAFVAIKFHDTLKVRNIVIQYRSARNSFAGVSEPVLLWDTWKGRDETDDIQVVHDYMDGLCSDWVPDAD